MNVISQNWLGERPIFYNKKTGRVAENINDVVVYSELEISPEGLHFYLKFGYSVFGLTPIKDVYFLRPNESLGYDESGRISLSLSSDPCLGLIEGATSEQDAWGVFADSINKISNSIDGDVCLPISGGFDSRLIASFYPKKSNIRAFTYGISRKQHESFESVNAKAVCEKLGLDWHLIELGAFNKFLPDWMDLYGASTHAHGMYHWEFYSKIRRDYGAMPLVSGIVGDAWAGSLSTVAPQRPDDLMKLGYSHGLTGSSDQCFLPYRNDVIEQEFESQRMLLSNERYRAIYLVRVKMILLSYLIKVPTSLGLKAVSPFTEFDVAMSMLTIDPSRWRGRIWQKDFMSKSKLDVENLSNYRSFRNDQDFDSMRICPLPPLSVFVLSELFNSEYIEWVNKGVNVFNKKPAILHWLLGVPKLGAALRRLGVSDQALKAYSAYLVLRPIENILLRRDLAQNESKTS